MWKFLRAFWVRGGGWLASHPRSVLVFCVLATLMPFVDKPFNMDDPLFIWAARHIQAHPADPYGCEVNWYGTATSMAEVTKNPPLACYYTALGGRIFGWSEVALHGAFLLPALAVALGTYRLARQLCGRPMLATLMSWLTPAMLVSSTTVMCDVLMLAFWVWAVALWIEGVARDSLARLIGASVLIGLASLTKYFGACLVVLLAAYSLIGRRRLGRCFACLLIPVGVLCAYGWTTRALYGRTLLLDAAAYVPLLGGPQAFASSKLAGCLIGLSFIGGGLAAAAFCAPVLWRGWTLAGLAGGTILFAAALLSTGLFLKDYGPLRGTTRLFLEGQIVFWAIGGACVLGLALTEPRNRGDADGWLLSLWVLGTFLFAGVLNWTVNGRSILPMAPAVGILVARRCGRHKHKGKSDKPPSTGVAIGLGAGAVLALFVTRADYLFARAVRESAHLTYVRYGQGPSRFWFQGHWGFQYYLQALGASALDAKRTPLRRGDVVAAPKNNTNLLPLRPELTTLREVFEVPGPALLTTMNGEVGAGFFASLRGPLPFAFGFVPPEQITVLALGPPNP